MAVFEYTGVVIATGKEALKLFIGGLRRHRRERGLPFSEVQLVVLVGVSLIEGGGALFPVAEAAPHGTRGRCP